MPLDVAGDWVVVDGTETISFFRRLTERDFDSPRAVDNTLGRVLDKDVMEARYQISRDGKVWHVWEEKLPFPVPAVNDVIEDADGVRWVVKKVMFGTLKSRYQIVCVRERQ
jgi:hypothetical protein